MDLEEGLLVYWGESDRWPVNGDGETSGGTGQSGIIRVGRDFLDFLLPNTDAKLLNLKLSGLFE
jgi:hypothetical protein